MQDLSFSGWASELDVVGSVRERIPYTFPLRVFPCDLIPDFANTPRTRSSRTLSFEQDLCSLWSGSKAIIKASSLLLILSPWLVSGKV